MTKRIYPLFLAFLLLAAALAAGCGGESDANGADDTVKMAPPTAEAPPTPAQRVIKIGVETVAPTIIRDMLTLPGQTEADKDVTLGSERGGRVEWVGPAEGDRVKKGQAIAKIDLALLQASLDKAQTAYDLAKQTAERRETLRAERVLSQEELDQARTEAMLAKADLRMARVNYDQGIVRAPFSGIVDVLHVDPGEYVDPGTPVAEMVDVARIRVNVNMPEMDVPYIAKGEKAAVTIDALPGRTLEGVVDFVPYKANDVTKTFKIRVLVDNDDGAIRPGMIARATFLRREVTDALTVPLFVILDRNGERTVYVEENGVARERVVEIGVIDRDRVQIVKGLEAGDHLITAGHTDVEDGTKVRIQ